MDVHELLHQHDKRITRLENDRDIQQQAIKNIAGILRTMNRHLQQIKLGAAALVGYAVASGTSLPDIIIGLLVR